MILQKGEVVSRISSQFREVVGIGHLDKILILYNGEVVTRLKVSGLRV